MSYYPPEEENVQRFIALASAGALIAALLLAYYS